MNESGKDKSTKVEKKWNVGYGQGRDTDHRGPRIIRKRAESSPLPRDFVLSRESCHYYSRDLGCVGLRPARATTVSPAELQGHYDARLFVAVDRDPSAKAGDVRRPTRDSYTRGRLIESRGTRDNLRSFVEREGTRSKESGENLSRLDEMFLHRRVDRYKHQGYAIIIMAGARGYIVGLEIKAKECAAVVSEAMPIGARETIIDNAQSTFTGNYLAVERVFCNLRKAE